MTTPGRFVLRLYVTGLTPRSTRAIRAVRAICEEELGWDASRFRQEEAAYRALWQTNYAPPGRG